MLSLVDLGQGKYWLGESEIRSWYGMWALGHRGFGDEVGRQFGPVNDGCPVDKDSIPVQNQDLPTLLSVLVFG